MSFIIDHVILSLTLDTLAKTFYVLFFRQKRNTKRRKLKPQRQQVDQTSADRGKKRHARGAAEGDEKLSERTFNLVVLASTYGRRQVEGPKE